VDGEKIESTEVKRGLKGRRRGKKGPTRDTHQSSSLKDAHAGLRRGSDCRRIPISIKNRREKVSSVQ